jgi:hypothetical protein
MYKQSKEELEKELEVFHKPKEDMTFLDYQMLGKYVFERRIRLIKEKFQGVFSRNKTK